MTQKLWNTLFCIYLLTIVSSVEVKSRNFFKEDDITKCAAANQEFGLLQYAPDNCSDRLSLLPLTKDIMGCRCKKGYVQESYNSTKCVRPSKCPCPKNQEWKSFDRNRKILRCNEPPQQYSYFFKYSPFYYVNRGCICKRGYRLNKRNDCVKPSACYRPK